MKDKSSSFPHALKTPFPRSYWVIPGQLLAGAYPGDREFEKARSKISNLLDAGIRQIVNLMEAEEEDREGRPFDSYEKLLESLAKERNTRAVMNRFPVVDMRIPEPATMMEILNTIDAAVDSGIPVYVHCWGGIGRTGTVVGCFLIRHGLAHSGNVIEQIANLRANDPEAHRISPENPVQREFVRQWQHRKIR